jgi:hypothetical protein
MRGLVEIAEDLARPLEEHGGGVGRRDLPGRAEKQFDPQPRLEARHHPRHRGLRDAELAGDPGEAASFGRPHEDGQFQEPVTHTPAVSVLCHLLVYRPPDAEIILSPRRR